GRQARDGAGPLAIVRRHQGQGCPGERDGHRDRARYDGASGKGPDLGRTNHRLRAVSRSAHGYAVCYNVQTAADSKDKLIVANDVTNDTSDRDCLSPVALQAKDILGGTFAAVADVGYYHGEEVKTCLEAGITPYVAGPITSANAKLGLFSKDDFRYDQ